MQDNAVLHCDPGRQVVLGKNCIIGAGALVPEGMVIPDNSVAVGVPARVIKTIRDDQLAHNIENAKAYVEMGRQHAALSNTTLYITLNRLYRWLFYAIIESKQGASRPHGGMKNV